MDAPGRVKFAVNDHVVATRGPLKDRYGVVRWIDEEAREATVVFDGEGRHVNVVWHHLKAAPGPQIATPAPARAAPAADEEPPVKGLSERPANTPEPPPRKRTARERKPPKRIVEAAAAAEKAAQKKKRKKQKTDVGDSADPKKAAKAAQKRLENARARAHVLNGRSLEEAEVDGLTSVEVQAWAVALTGRWVSESKSKCQDACKSWFESNGGRPFVLSEQRAGELRLKWPDAEAIAAQAAEKQRVSRTQTVVPPPTAATLSTFAMPAATAPPMPLPNPRERDEARAWQASFAPPPSAPLLPPDAELLARYEAHKLLNHKMDAQKTAAESPEKFRQRGPASISFESIDRRSF